MPDLSIRFAMSARYFEMLLNYRGMYNDFEGLTRHSHHYSPPTNGTVSRKHTFVPKTFETTLTLSFSSTLKLLHRPVTFPVDWSEDQFIARDLEHPHYHSYVDEENMDCS